MDTADPRAAGQVPRQFPRETQPMETLLLLHQHRRACLHTKVLGSPPGMSCKVRVGNEAPICPHSPRELHTWVTKPAQAGGFVLPGEKRL